MSDKIVIAISKDGVLSDSFSFEINSDTHVVMLHDANGKPEFFCVGINEGVVFGASEHKVKEFYGHTFNAMTAMSELQKFTKSKRIKAYLRQVGEYLQKGVTEAIRLTGKELTPEELERGEAFFAKVQESAQNVEKD